jgi:hypothetical protein
MGQTGRRSIATHILAVKIVSAAAHLHGLGVAPQGPWDTWVNKGKKKEDRGIAPPPSLSTSKSPRMRTRGLFASSFFGRVPPT